MIYLSVNVLEDESNAITNDEDEGNEGKIENWDKKGAYAKHT